MIHDKTTTTTTNGRRRLTRCLAHAGFGLTHNVTTEYGLWDAFVLHLRRMFKTGIDNAAQQFGFEQKIFKSGCVNANVVSLFGILGGSSSTTRTGGAGRRRVLAASGGGDDIGNFL